MKLMENGKPVTGFPFSCQNRRCLQDDLSVTQNSDKDCEGRRIPF